VNSIISTEIILALAVIGLVAVAVAEAVVIARLSRIIAALRLSSNGFEFRDAMGKVDIRKTEDTPNRTAHKRKGM